MLIIDCQPPDKLNTKVISHHQTDWINFNISLSGKFDLKTRLKTINDIDNAVNLLTHTIQSSIWESSKLLPYKKSLDNLPIYIRTLISVK
jgi:hypothetical protein